MSKYTKEILPIEVNFDIELIMSLMQETRMGGEILEDLVQTFEKWMKELTCMVLDTGKGKFFVAYLNEKIEQEVDKIWETSPERSFRINCVGQAIIMNAVYQVMPEIEDAGCAPSPRPIPELAEALQAEGIPYLEGEPTIVRRFSVVTSYPFHGACEICFLREDCPKAQGQGENFHSVELSGLQ